MVRKAELARDRYYKMAKERGYRARSAYKLKDMESRFRLIKPGDTVIDLGAAPGGWTQVAKELAGDRGMVISVDLQRISGIEGVIAIESDITDHEATINAISSVLTHAADVVLSDAAPKLSGNRAYDHYRSFVLSNSALHIAKAFLKPGGNFVAKIFQSEYYNAFYNAVKAIFHDTRAYTPESSRKRSAEVFVIGRGFKSQNNKPLKDVKV